MARAQAFSDRFASLEWPRILNPYARKVNPLMQDILELLPYYWVTAQSEYSTDILFKSASHLNELYPRLLSHSTLCFGAKEVMSFLGKKGSAPSSKEKSLPMFAISLSNAFPVRGSNIA